MQSKLKMMTKMQNALFQIQEIFPSSVFILYFAQDLMCSEELYVQMVS